MNDVVMALSLQGTYDVISGVLGLFSQKLTIEVGIGLVVFYSMHAEF
jgi:hypothetical protein